MDAMSDQGLPVAEEVELLAIGPHPDDIEIGIGCTIAKHTQLGHRVGLCDLTAGEMGSNGTVEERLAEGEKAREVLGAAWRVNLRLPDRALGSSPEQAIRIASLVRAARPRVVAIPYWQDRHPDHVAASHLLTDAIFSAGLRRFPAQGEAWKPTSICYYFINDVATPSFVVDVSAQYDTKRRALACHVTQFRPSGDGAVATRLTSSRFAQLIESRDAQFGAACDADYAEGFVVRQPLVRAHLLP
jgi:bacillithiol biosynthesis deacetylase BshB1